jgi:hypothetical protein
MKKIIALVSIVLAVGVTGYRINKIRQEGSERINNIVRIHEKNGAPKDHIIVTKTTDVLLEPLYVEKGRALVSKSRINKFSVGQKVKGTSSKIVSVSNNINLDSGMFVIIISPAISGNVMIEKEYTGFFVPLDSDLPNGVKVIAKDANRMVVIGLNDGDKVVVK